MPLIETGCGDDRRNYGSGHAGEEKSPFTYSTVSKEISMKPGAGHSLSAATNTFVCSNFDAGAGVGYLISDPGHRLKQGKCNHDGIPLNDAESHGTWFVDQPDLASSLENIQIQRGVGTSTNGAAAFGATINLQTNTLKKDTYAEYNTAFGSFNTFKNTVSAGTGF